MTAIPVVVDIIGAVLRRYGRCVSACSDEEVGLAVLDAAGLPIDRPEDLERARQIGAEFRALPLCRPPDDDEQPEPHAWTPRGSA